MDPTNNLTPNPNADSAPSPEPENNVESSAVQTPEINSAPVNPIIQPSGSSEPVPGQASANPIQPLSNPIVRPSGLGATDPLLMPEKPQAPDPVEEELKAPMKAAAPVPGSIGSAVSGPSDGVTNAEETPVKDTFSTGDSKPTPSVSFNDPAMQPDPNATNTASTTPAKKKNDKLILMILIAIAAVIVVALAIILIVQLSKGGGNANNNTNNSNNNNSQIAVDDNDEDDVEGEEDIPEEIQPVETVYTSSVVCSSSTNDASGNASERITFGLVDDSLVEAKVERNAVDENGSSVGNSAEIITIEKYFEGNQSISELIDSDGKLLVAESELGSRLQAILNSDGTANYSCQSA